MASFTEDHLNESKLPPTWRPRAILAKPYFDS
jgi:hypothetical protein